tara:strand:- start:252 stop:455 length:204 start_codon:yes stop_codon:yes gene_type:complete
LGKKQKYFLQDEKQQEPELETENFPKEKKETKKRNTVLYTPKGDIYNTEINTGNKTYKTLHHVRIRF